MSKFGGIRYNSLWDWSTWLIMAFSVGVCIWPLFLDDDRTWRIVLIILTCVFIAFLLVLFKGVYYRIDGNNLVVYQFFLPNVFPIDKIESVKEHAFGSGDIHHPQDSDKVFRQKGFEKLNAVDNITGASGRVHSQVTFSQSGYKNPGARLPGSGEVIEITGNQKSVSPPPSMGRILPSAS